MIALAARRALVRRVADVFPVIIILTSCPPSRIMIDVHLHLLPQ